MRYIPLFRFLSLFALSGAIAALFLGGGAFAQTRNSPAYVPQNIQNLSTGDLPSSVAASNTNALNWAGYVATGGTYTSVSGSWIVPTVQATSAENLADATWVGIGGVTSNDLIQAGTEALPNSKGQLVYQAWMEILPQDSEAVPLTISPGDSISVSITEQSSNIWEVSFDDATTGQVYRTSVTYDSSLSSAEWVEEMPVEIGGVIGLDDFGTLNFTSGYAIKNGQYVTIQSSGAKALTMENAEGTAVAAPSALGPTGSNFSVTRTDADSSPLALTRNGVSVVAPASSSGYALAGGYGTGTYTMRMRRGRGGYQIIIQF